MAETTEDAARRKDDAEGVPEKEETARGRRRRLTAIIATAGVVVGLATGVLTLRDQLFPREQVSGVAPRVVPEFSGIAGHFLDSRAFIEFLIANNREIVLLDVTLRVPDQDVGGELGFPPTLLKTDCHEGAAPGSQLCDGVEIVVLGEPNDDTLFGVAHGQPVLDGYFEVDVSSREFQGVRPIALRPRTRSQATAAL